LENNIDEEFCSPHEKNSKDKTNKYSNLFIAKRVLSNMRKITRIMKNPRQQNISFPSPNGRKNSEKR
jgi:hypothetical protein